MADSCLPPQNSSATLCRRRSPAIRRASACLLPLVLYLTSLTGCAGYQFGNRALYRPDIRTVYVPMFESDSLRHALAERLTESVVKEIEQRTSYKVLADPAADSVLTGRILVERKHVIAENINDEARDLEVQFVVQVSWIDRRGGLMMQNVNIPLMPFDFAVTQTENFIPEAGQSIATAHQDALEEIAQQIVSQMEIAW